VRKESALLELFIGVAIFGILSTILMPLFIDKEYEEWKNTPTWLNFEQWKEQKWLEEWAEQERLKRYEEYRREKK